MISDVLTPYDVAAMYGIKFSHTYVVKYHLFRAVCPKLKHQSIHRNVLLIMINIAECVNRYKYKNLKALNC